MSNTEFIQKNYSKLGLKQCSELLNISKGKISYIVEKFNLKLTKKEKSKILMETRAKKSSDYNVPLSKFTTELNEISTYVLGLLWADGYIAKNTPNTKQRYDINIECIDDDMTFFRIMLDKTGVWNFHSRQRNDWRQITKATTCNKELLTYLIKNEYHEKSLKSPTKIISKIPTHLIRYFILGVIDGDGCFYFNQKHFLRQFTIAGSLNQDWSSFEAIFNELGIIYKINRRPNNKTGSSDIRILNKTNIKKLGEYIYPTFEKDKIGLPRKYKKYLEIIE